MEKIEFDDLRSLKNGTFLHLLIDGQHERMAKVTGNIPGDEKFKIQIYGSDGGICCIDQMPKGIVYSIMYSDDEWLIPLREKVMGCLFEASDPFLGKIPKEEIAGEITAAAAVFVAMAMIELDDVPTEEIKFHAVDRFRIALDEAFERELEVDWDAESELLEDDR